MNFTDCHLIEPIVRALTEQGYTQPTPIQAGAIPPALEGRDVLGLAQTGTGKTCAFAAPILQRLTQHPVQGHPIRALVLTPTRELAIQNQECFEAYSRYLDLTSVVIFGGVGQAPQVQAIQKGADILIATPGRLEDLHQQGFIDLEELEIFVLDEADRMLDMGFIHDVRKILKWLPKKKQTLFFSATMPKEITKLVASLLHKPARVAVNPVNTTVEAIRQSVYKVDRANKTKLLVELLKDESLTSVLVFTRTKHGANKVCKDLTKAGISAAAIHGNKSQTARQEALAGFKSGDIRVLVATDIAARGLDIEELACVVNYNLPEVPETYVHRIGRTGRAGREGVAVALVEYSELPLLKDIEKLMKKTVPIVEEHPYPMENFEELKKDKNGKVRNPEDEEARAAARERAKERRAARQEESAQETRQKEKSGAKKRKKQGEPQDGGGPEAQSPAAPEKTEKKGKKGRKNRAEAVKEPEAMPQQTAEEAPKKEKKPAKKQEKKQEKKSLAEEMLGGIVPIPDLLPKREERPIEPETRFDSNDILKRKYKRPEKRVIPSLASVSLLPTIELKETFGNTSAGLEFRPDNLPKPTEKPAKKAKQSAKKSEEAPKQEQKPAQKAAKKQEPKKQEPKKPEPKKAQPKKQEKKQEPKKPEPKPEKKPEPAQQERRVVFTVADKNARIKPKDRGQQGKGRSRQKDSTEQKSLMKPYYLSDRRKG